MGITGISSYTTNTYKRVTGLASNMDTDTMVKQAMQAETAKYTKILQNRQISEWKIESYRDATSTLQDFYKEYFDISATKKLKSADSFASFSTSYAATNSTNYVSVTPGASAKAGTYSITKLKAATAASISGVNVTKPVEGLDVLDTDVQGIKSQNDNNTFVFTLNNVTKEFKLNGSSYVAGFQAELQTKLDDAFGTGKIIVGFTPNGTGTGGKLNFSAVRNTDSFSIGTAYNDGATDLFSAVPTTDDPFSVSSGNNKFELTLGGVTKTVSVATGSYTNVNDLTAAIQSAADTAFGAGAITFSGANGKVVYTSGQTVTISKTVIDANGKLGIQTSNMSNKLDLTKKIDAVKDSFATSLSVSGTENDIEFTINGKYFRFNSKNVSINDIMKTVNADTTINATMKYDITTNSFKVESKNTGDAVNVVVVDKTGNLMSALGVNGTDNGSDASVTVNGMEIVRPSNSFTYDGLTFNIKNDFISTDPAVVPQPAIVIDPIKVTVSSDPEKAYDFVKTFVDKYNEVIDKLNDKIAEKRYKDYLPLTDEQQSAMSEEQIKNWEVKAKSGLLRNDSIVSNVLSQMRSALYAAVEGSGIKLTSIGITTSSNYEDKGKLVIDEAKLKDALASKPEEVARLFTSNSDVTYYEAINSSIGSKLRSQRYTESGIAQRFSDIIQDAIRTNTDISGNKGTLLEKAGIVGDRSEYKSVLAKEILEYDDDAYEMNKKLVAKENALYKKYAAMESALNKLNSQSSWLAQQFGG
jgi:flagellar hook-associated protein 2